MMTKRLLAVLAATVFTLSLASPTLAGHIEDEMAARMGVEGTVTKIEGSKVTFKDSKGTEQTIEAKGPDALKDINIGDRVAVKDGKLMKTGGGGEPTSPSPRPTSGPKY